MGGGTQCFDHDVNNFFCKTVFNLLLLKKIVLLNKNYVCLGDLMVELGTKLSAAGPTSANSSFSSVSDQNGQSRPIQIW